MSNEVGTF